MSEPNYGVDPIFDSEDEWLACGECGDDYLRYDKHCEMCEECVQKELKENEEKEGKEMETAISWGELAELTHETQVERFGFCSCEEQEYFPYSDCPKREGSNNE